MISKISFNTNYSAPSFSGYKGAHEKKVDSWERYQASRSNSNPFVRAHNRHEDKVHAKEVAQEEKARQNRFDAFVAMTSYDAMLPDCRNTRKCDSQDFLELADSFYKTQDIAFHQNPIYASGKHPRFVDLKGGMRIYYDQTSLKTPYLDTPIDTNSPTRVTKGQLARKDDHLLCENIYDFEAGYAANNLRLYDDGRFECDRFAALEPQNDKLKNLDFVKYMNMPMVAENLRLSANKNVVTADSMTFFVFDKDHNIKTTRTYIAPKITYSKDDPSCFKIVSNCALISAHSPNGISEKTFSDFPSEKYKNGKLNRKIASFMVITDDYDSRYGYISLNQDVYRGGFFNQLNETCSYRQRVRLAA